MAVAMMMASLPAISVIVVADCSGPNISLDVCHPIQSMDTSSNLVLIARPAPPEIGATIIPRETFAEFAPRPRYYDLADTPDPPPPKIS